MRLFVLEMPHKIPFFARIYDVTNPKICLQDIRLSLNSLGYSKYAAPLGQTAVSFDFGPSVSPLLPSLNQEISIKQSPSLLSNTTSSPSNPKVSINEGKGLIWPIYVLRGNGDVILVHNSLENSYASRKIYGPLTMRPPAEDNYGVDASSLICLDTTPPILVIATSSMMIYHCIAMDVSSTSHSEPDYSQYREPDETTGHELVLSPNIESANFSRALTPRSALVVVEEESYSTPSNEKILYVLESLELVLSLTSIAEQELYSPVRLLKSAASPQIYSCCAEAGIFLINVTCVQQLKQSQFLTEELEASIVEYLVCTKPISSSSAPASIPLGIATRPKRGRFLVAVLLSTGEILTQNMTSIHLSSLEYIDQSVEEPKLDPSVSFAAYINQIFKRTMNAPLIKSEIKEEPDIQALLLVLMNATELIRKEYLVRMEKASEIMSKRAKFLVSSKEFQFEEFSRLESEQHVLQELINHIIQRYNKVFNRQEELSQRVEKVLETLQIRLNHLSEAEITCKSELEELSKIVNAFKNKRDQIKMKIKYQQALREKNESDKKGNFPLLTRQIQSVRSILSHQGQVIQELVGKLNKIKKPQAIMA